MTTSTMSTHGSTLPGAQLDRRLHDVGWGLLLMLTGAVSLVPADRIPEGAWLVGVAVILLGVNIARYAHHIAVSGFTVMLGVLALAAGASRAVGVDLPLLAICLVVIGASLALRPWTAGPRE